MSNKVLKEEVIAGHLKKRVERKEDGRLMIYYSASATPPGRSSKDADKGAPRQADSQTQ